MRRLSLLLRKTPPNPKADSGRRRDVSDRLAAVCFLVTRLFVIVSSAPDSLSSDTHPTPPHTHHHHPRSQLQLYFPECLQYLLEAKKAQQSLESTYKQLDSVSLEDDVKLTPVHILSCITVRRGNKSNMVLIMAFLSPSRVKSALKENGEKRSARHSTQRRRIRTSMPQKQMLKK